MTTAPSHTLRNCFTILFNLALVLSLLPVVSFPTIKTKTNQESHAFAVGDPIVGDPIVGDPIVGYPIVVGNIAHLGPDSHLYHHIFNSDDPTATAANTLHHAIRVRPRCHTNASQAIDKFDSLSDDRFLWTSQPFLSALASAASALNIITNKHCPQPFGFVPTMPSSRSALAPIQPNNGSGPTSSPPKKKRKQSGSAGLSPETKRMKKAGLKVMAHKLAAERERVQKESKNPKQKVDQGFVANLLADWNNRNLVKNSPELQITQDMLNSEINNERRRQQKLAQKEAAKAADPKKAASDPTPSTDLTLLRSATDEQNPPTCTDGQNAAPLPRTSKPTEEDSSVQSDVHLKLNNSKTFDKSDNCHHCGKMPTNHRCRCPDGSSRFFLDDKRICGKPICSLCYDNSGQHRCSEHGGKLYLTAPPEQTTASSASIQSSVPGDVQNPSTSTSNEPKPSRNKGGRPKGSTKAAAFNEKEAKIAAVDYVVEKYVAAKIAANESGRKQVDTGLRAKLVQEAKLKFGVKDPRFDVTRQTISGREKTGRLNVRHPGTVSPMAPIEDYLVAAIELANKMHQPMDKYDVIKMANEVIEGTEHEERIRKFKFLRAHVDDIDDILEPVGVAWYRGFMQRNAHRLTKKKKTNFAVNRSNSCTYDLFETFYDSFEGIVVETGNGEYRDKPVFMDVNANITDDETKMVGHAINVDVTHSQNIIYGDEVGINTNMKDDGNIGGQTFVVPKNMKAMLLAAIKDPHATVIGWTAASGEPVMVCIIFKAKKLNDSWRDGFDLFQEDELGGPTVTFKGIEVPCFIDCSSSGSINATILTNILKKMDELMLFERGGVDGGPVAPIICVDGHGSRLGLEFLDYVLDPETRWYPILGPPNQTHKWQLGDSPEQNGVFKIETYREKRRILRKKKRHPGVALCIELCEISPMVRRACQKSFFRTDSNIRAMARRGLGITMNRACLDDPDVLATASKEYQIERRAVLVGRKDPRYINLRSSPAISSFSTAPADPSTLNLSQGFAADLLGLLLDEHKRQGGDLGHEARKKKGAEARKRLDEFKRVTAGSVYATTGPVLNEEVQDVVRGRFNAQNEKQAEVKKRANDKMKSLEKEVKKIRRLPKYRAIVSSKEWREGPASALKSRLDHRTRGLTNEQLLILCKWKRQKGDQKMPTKKAARIDRLISTRHRDDPVISDDTDIAEDGADVSQDKESESGQSSDLEDGGAKSDEDPILDDDDDDDDDNEIIEDGDGDEDEEDPILEEDDDDSDGDNDYVEDDSDDELPEPSGLHSGDGASNKPRRSTRKRGGKTQ